jgi:hypothetical protein
VKKREGVNFLTNPQDGSCVCSSVRLDRRVTCLCEFEWSFSIVELRTGDFMHNNIVSSRSMDVVFKRIGFAIQKGLATQLVARLPFIHV